jgi:hypothetical protein
LTQSSAWPPKPLLTQRSSEGSDRVEITSFLISNKGLHCSAWTFNFSEFIYLKISYHQKVNFLNSQFLA